MKYLMLAAMAMMFTACGDTVTGSVKRQDWQTIHQPAPTTPGGGD